MKDGYMRENQTTTADDEGRHYGCVSCRKVAPVTVQNRCLPYLYLFQTLKKLENSGYPEPVGIVPYPLLAF
jgi:hypothetical protein